LYIKQIQVRYQSHHGKYPPGSIGRIKPSTRIDASGLSAANLEHTHTGYSAVNLEPAAIHDEGSVLESFVDKRVHIPINVQGLLRPIWSKYKD
jgi:hypothetical protein